MFEFSICGLSGGVDPVAWYATVNCWSTLDGWGVFPQAQRLERSDEAEYCTGQSPVRKMHPRLTPAKIDISAGPLVVIDFAYDARWIKAHRVVVTRNLSLSPIPIRPSQRPLNAGPHASSPRSVPVRNRSR